MAAEKLWHFSFLLIFPWNSNRFDELLDKFLVRGFREAFHSEYPVRIQHDEHRIRRTEEEQRGDFRHHPWKWVILFFFYSFAQYFSGSSSIKWFDTWCHVTHTWPQQVVKLVLSWVASRWDYGRNKSGIIRLARSPPFAAPAALIHQLRFSHTKCNRRHN